MEEIIRVRTGVAVVKDSKILLVPHYNTNFAPLQWYLPGGKVEFGESVEEAARREFMEETGYTVQLDTLLDVNEIIIKEKPWHSLSICYRGTITGGALSGETNHPYGDKTPRWFALEALKELNYHPARAIDKALKLYEGNH